MTFAAQDMPSLQPLLTVLADILSTYNDDEQQVTAAYDRRELRALVQQHVPVWAQELQAAAEILDSGTGVQLFRNDEWSAGPISLTRLTAITLSCCLGQPTRTQPNNPCLAWPIHAEQLPTSARPTFSQTTGEAALHTDTQYFEQAEPWFSLWCVHADRPGFGTSELLAVDNILPQLSGATIEQLSMPYPFRVPPVFTQTQTDDAQEVFWAPILTEDIIRYRYDTLCDALAIPTVIISREQQDAWETLEHILQASPRVQHHLQPGEILLVNNQRWLHARTPFQDRRRLLYRIRLQRPTRR